jgi:hypothetical protein
MDGQHLVAPHPTDTSPSQIVELGNTFSRVLLGSGMAMGAEDHDEMF